MRILIVSGLYDPYIKGGAEVMAATLARGMLQRGHFVGVATTHEGNGVLTENRDGVEIRRYGIKNSYWHFTHDKAPAIKRMLWHWRDSFNTQAASDIVDAVEKFRPDVAVCHNLTGFSVNAWGVLAKCGVPVVQVLHDYYNLCPRSALYKNGRVCETRCLSCSSFRMRHPKASRSVTGVIGVSRSILEIHERFGMFVDTPVKRVIYNARALDLQEVQSREKKGLVFGYIGSLLPEKGIGLLLQAFRHISAEHPETRLIVAGEGSGEYVADLKRSVEEFPVQFIGRVNPADFYCQLDVCVVPSLLNEALGMVAFEALAQGVPVVASSRGGLAEIVLHQTNGLIFDPAFETALYDSLSEIIRNPTCVAIFAKAARNSVSRFIDVESMMREHEDVYQEATLVGARADLR